MTNDATKDIFADMANQMKPGDELLAALDARVNAAWQPPNAVDGKRSGRSPAWRGRLLAGLLAAACVVGLAVANLAKGGAVPGGWVPFLPTRFVERVASDYGDLYQTMRTLLNAGFYGGRDTAVVSADSAPVAGAPEALTHDVTGTNVQVAGIDEPDIVKTNGEQIYILSDTEVVVLLADGAATREVSRFSWPGVTGSGTPGGGVMANEMMLHGDTLALLTLRCGAVEGATTGMGRGDDYAMPANTCYTEALLYDVSDPTAPRLVTTLGQSGWLQGARLQNGVLYLVSNYSVFTDAVEISPDIPETFAPVLTDDGAASAMEPSDIVICPAPSAPNYAVISSINMTTRERIDQQSVLGAADTSYMSADNLYLAGVTYGMVALDQLGSDATVMPEPTLVPDDVDVSKPIAPTADDTGKSDTVVATPAPDDPGDTSAVPPSIPPDVEVIEPLPYDVVPSTPDTNLVRIALTDGTLNVAANGTVPGWVIGQFALDEYRGNLRVAVSTNGKDWALNAALYVLNPNLEIIGRIESLITDESVQSVRFMGEIGYVVTFRQTDPLFAIDLSDPSAPTVMSTLHLPGFSSYLHPWGTDRLLGLGFQGDENGLIGGIKLAVFDVSDLYAVFESQALALEYDYSEAQYDHHAVLADERLGLVAFPVTSYSNMEDGDKFNSINEYAVYRDSGVFELATTIRLAGDAYRVRGMLIDGVLYVYDGSAVRVCDTADFDLLTEVPVR
ncbi:MAG: beta-propeller domain-containing protein [Propionibacteriaceae bacterium]|jgi:uncharacterized secreted protein with C-terminal beta-propeller domain|nr:beta-propeller domain-containing protein [Propionibacteriaceae bacterium]